MLGGAPKRRYAHIGDVIKVSIKDAAPRGRVKKGDYTTPSWCARATACAATRRQGVLRHQRRRAAHSKREPIGTRIFGPVARELRTERIMKIVSLAPEVL